MYSHWCAISAKLYLTSESRASFAFFSHSAALARYQSARRSNIVPIQAPNGNENPAQIITRQAFGSSVRHSTKKATDALAGSFRSGRIASLGGCAARRRALSGERNDGSSRHRERHEAGRDRRALGVDHLGADVFGPILREATAGQGVSTPTAGLYLRSGSRWIS